MKKRSLHIGFLLFLLGVSTVSIAQNSPIQTGSIAPLTYPFSSSQYGSLFLNNPATTTITYDKQLQKFIITQMIGGYAVGTPLFLTPKEYDAYRLKNDIKEYFQEKIAATNPNKKGNEAAQKDLMPKYYVNSKFFESIFGGNTVEVTPSGQVNLKLGFLYQNNDNPQISQKNRSSFTFDFDQQISASLKAKIGTRLKFDANYDTQSTFDFQNLIKLGYEPTEDAIVRSIDAGNVSMPIKNTLIDGAQSLFGVKTELQFGNTNITAVFSQQNSESKTVVSEGGATTQSFELRASDYDNDRHFFLSQFFRETYKAALQHYPLISSPINITRVEVWITNKNSSTENFRSIVALADIGEAVPENLVNPAVLPATPPTVMIDGQSYAIPTNTANNIASLLTTTNGIRDIATMATAFTDASLTGMQQGTDYSYLQNARRLQENEYTVHPQLGFISLNRRLNDGEVLGIAYEYTVVGATGTAETIFKVGEFSNDGINAPANIALKLLRSEILTTKRPGTELPFPTWQLMLKNVYALGASPLTNEGFRFEILYRDDETGVPQNTLQNANTPNITDKTLLNLLSLDRLDQSQYVLEEGDGFLDYIEGITINSQKGYVIFPETMPFGEDLDVLLTDLIDKERYVFNELYSNTKSQAKNEYQHKDKFLLKGYFTSENSGGISLGAFNVPRGSVHVTAGGIELVEGVDYVVDYQLGRVQIIDPGLESSGTPISVSTENNALFNQQQKTFMGIDVQHKFSEEFVVGATVLNLSERPITPKVNFGAEPINNTMFGFNLNYATEVPFLTKMANKLPFVDTDVVSNFSIKADMAYLLPGSPRGINVSGEATSYVDDFEASQIPIDLSSPLSWFTASTPDTPTFPLFQGNAVNNLTYNNQRAKLAWYTIDQLFYGIGNTPNNINATELSRAEVRQIRYEELFPNQQLDITQNPQIRTLDLAYFPTERGPYNFDPTATVDTANETVTLSNPSERWGGMMRSLTTNNFQQANVEYIQFWMMDPYENYSITEEEGLPTGMDPQHPINQVGDLYFNLGNISEDILRDSYKQYENGLPSDGIKTLLNTNETTWGTQPKNPSILYAFDVEDGARTHQDVGLDGLNDTEEAAKFPIQFQHLTDPAGDNFQYFRGAGLDADDASIISRYKHFNSTQGNSPTANQSTESFPTSSTTYPDVEDINKDQTMNVIESYFEYKVSMNKADLTTGTNHIVDQKTTEVTLADGTTRNTTWYQFRIPIRSGVAVNNISDFNSIRFIRMYLTKFKMPVVLRFGELQLVRGDWRRYTKTLNHLITPPVELSEASLNNFEVGVVNIEQNENRYVVPPGIVREQLQGTTSVQLQNEQSVAVKVWNLKQGETRAIYKNNSADLRSYKKLKMFMHAESIDIVNAISDDDMVAVIRLGTDLDENYYQLEMPLKVSESGVAPVALEVWPEANNLEAVLEKLGALKLARIREGAPVNELYPTPSSVGPTELILHVKGNPTLAAVRTIMLGVKNTAIGNRSAEIWFNELRSSGFDNKGGWAAVVNANANLADVADISLAGSIQTIGFGNVGDRVQQRNIEESKQYNLAATVNLGKMLPKKWHLQVPLSYSYGEEFRNPKYDPQYQDVTMEAAQDVNPNSKNAQDYTRRKSISFINVKKNRNPTSKKKPQFYNIENFTASYAYNEEFHKDYNIERYQYQNVLASGGYAFAFKPFVFEPFKKTPFLQGKHWQIVRDFNLSPFPKTLAVHSNIQRTFNEQKSRNLITGLTPQPTLTQRRFLFDWDYAVGFQLTKAVQLNFTAANNYIYDNQNESLEIFDKFFTVGRSDHYQQKLNATYTLPINKIPLFSFIKADYAYTANFDWQAASQSYVEKVGNLLQNANTHSLNANLNFERFYKTIGLTKLVQKNTGRQTTKNAKIGVKTIPKKKQTPGQKIVKGVYDVLTAVKKAKISYTENNGTLLEGYRPQAGFLGRNTYNGSRAPSFGFVFGSQVDIRNTALENGWLVDRHIDSAYVNKNYGRTHFNKLEYTVTVKPFKDLSIDLRGNRIQTRNSTQQLDAVGTSYDSEGGLLDVVLNLAIQAFETGNFSSSYLMISTAFKNSEALFETFKNHRSAIAERLTNVHSGTDIAHFGNTSQQVLLPSFMAAYSGTSTQSVKLALFRNMPIPNWTMRYKGFMKMKWFKKRFSSFAISNAYRSSYTLGNFTGNSQYNATAPFEVPNALSLNYEPALLISTATLVDEFSPLIKVDLKMKNSFSFKGEVKKDRALTLNFDNSTLTEIKGTEYVFGIGYKFKNVKMNSRFAGKKTTLKGDINLRADVSLRDNLTVIRAIDEENNQITGGQTLLGIKVVADYNLSRNITASFYYNHNTSKYAISTAFPRQSISSGINIIYKLGN